MHRRQLLARVMTTGLVLVGAPRLLQERPTGPRAVDLFIAIKANDEASAALREAEASLNRLPYVVGEHGPTLLSGYLQPMGPVPDYKWLAGTRWEVIPAEVPMSTWWQ